MINISDEFKKVLVSDNVTPSDARKFKLSFYSKGYDSLFPAETLFPEDSLFPSEQNEVWVLIENDRIESESLTITESLCDNSNLEFGSCSSALLEIVVADVIEDLTGKEFFLTEEVGEYQIPLGYYTVESYVRQSDRRKRKITAYNRMRLFNTDVSSWYNGLTFPISIREMRDSLCEYIGVRQIQTDLLFDSLKVEKTINPVEISGMEILKAICQINVSFGYIDKNGLLKYIQIQQTGLYPSETLYPDDNELYPSELGSDGRSVQQIMSFKSLEYEDKMIEGYTGLQIFQQNGEIGASVGDAGNLYTISGNFLLYGKTVVELLNIAQSIFPYVYGRTYRPCTLECRAMPWIEPGDALRIITRDDIIETFCMKRTMSGCQAMMDSIESSADESENATNDLYNSIKEVDGKSYLLMEQADKIVLSMDDLSKDIASNFEITNRNISAEIKRATDAEGEISNNITQTESEITTVLTKSNENLQSQISQNAKNISLLVSQGGLSAAISQESGQISITGNRFTWKANNSSMTADGTLTCNGIIASRGNFSGTITGTNISGSTLTGIEIKGNFITANEISASTIDGTNFELGSLDVVQLKTDDEIGADDSAQINIQNITAGIILCKGDDPSQIDWVIAKKYSGPIPKEDSDSRLKRNITSLSTQESEEFLNSLTPVFFEYKRNGISSAGLIAQDVAENVLSEEYGNALYQFGKDDHLVIDYNNYIGILISGVQNMSRRLNSLMKRKGK
jgi:hypothetical protein